MVDINDDDLTKAFFSGCETITNTVKATNINFNKYHLTVTYDATKDVTQSPQVKFHHSSGFVGIRLPTTNSKQINNTADSYGFVFHNFLIKYALPRSAQLVNLIPGTVSTEAYMDRIEVDQYE